MMTLLYFEDFIMEAFRELPDITYATPEFTATIKKLIPMLFIPNEIKDILMSWNNIIKSPLSNSYYNATFKSFNDTEDGTIRIADHWNYKSSHGDPNVIHSKSIGKVPTNYWAYGIYNKEQNAYIIKNTWLQLQEEFYLEKKMNKINNFNSGKLKTYYIDMQINYYKNFHKFKQEYDYTKLKDIQFNYEEIHELNEDVKIITKEYTNLQMNRIQFLDIERVNPIPGGFVFLTNDNFINKKSIIKSMDGIIKLYKQKKETI